MKKSYFAVVGLSALVGVPLVAQPSQPNIILFLVDDMGWQDTSVPFFGNEKSQLNCRYKTPNMERLAARGVKFVNAYAAPVSSPSRVSLITGCNPARHKVTNWTDNVRSDVSTDAPHPRFDFEPWNINGVSPLWEHEKVRNVFPAKTFPKILQENGYRTILVGKAHFGTPKTLASDPKNLGFDVNIAGRSIGAPETYLVNANTLEDGGYAYGNGGNRIVELSAYNRDGCYLTEALTRAALDEIDKAQAGQKPFFLYFSHYAVHAPYAADRALDKRFAGDYPDLKGQQKTYATMISSMDKSLGDILDRIDRDPALAKNTVVFFMSDNGGHHSNGNMPARGGKGSCFEGGIHEPMIAWWQGVSSAGDVCDAPVIIEDFFPTILELAKVKPSAIPQDIDGKSFASEIRGSSSPRIPRQLVFHYPNHWGEYNGRIGSPSSAIIEGRWKLVYFYDDQKTMLFDLKNDIGEKHDLAAERPTQAKALAVKLTHYLKKRQATRPVLKSTRKPVPWPDGTQN
ncbi:MAG: sulfatase [Opitutales bacterium]|nr:sulfatase [Opitutales bacterium]